MDEMQKLSLVIEHWIEHNRSHMEEYQKWSQKAEKLGILTIKTHIEEAIADLSQSNHHLQQALLAIPQRVSA